MMQMYDFLRLYMSWNVKKYYFCTTMNTTTYMARVSLVLINFVCATFLFPLCNAVCCMGQSVPYVFHHKDTGDGLLNNEVKAILKDHYGYLWVATTSGLNRYDGSNMRSYAISTMLANTPLSDDMIMLHEDGDGNVWISGKYISTVYLRAKERFVDGLEMLQYLSIPSGEIHAMYVDHDGRVWALNGKTLYCYDFKTGSVSKCPFEGNTDIEWMDDSNGRLILVDSDGSVCSLDTKTKQWTTLMWMKGAKTVNRVYCGRDHSIWAYSTVSSHMSRLAPGDNEWQPILLDGEEGNFIRAIQEDAKGRVWIATDHRGIYVYDKDSRDVTTLLHRAESPTSISESAVASIYIDSDEVVWVGHIKKGLSYYHASFGRFENHVVDQLHNVSAVAEDHDGNLWIGTDGMGLFCMDAQSHTVRRRVEVPGNIVVCLESDSKGRLWIGTYQHGLLCYADGRLQQYTKSNSGIADDNVWDIKIDRTGGVWIGELLGYVQRFDPDTREFTAPRKDKTVENIAMSLAYSGGADVYAATLSGLCKINIVSGKVSQHYGNAKGTMQYKHASINTVYRDHKGMLWLGHNQGVTVWDMDADTLYYIDRANGLCDDVVRGIEEDDLGQVWIATSNGCSVVTRVSDGAEGYAFQCNNYSDSEGLLDNNLSRHSIKYLSTGKMFIGSAEGYTLIDMQSLANGVKTASRVTFTGLSIGDREVCVDSLTRDGRIVIDRPIEQLPAVHLNYNDSYITVTFSDMRLVYSGRPKYSYRLEGLNTEWMTTSEGKVTFSSLPPGHYRLQVRSMTDDGVWDVEYAELEILVASPWYASALAYTIYVVLAIAVVIFGFMWYRRRSYRRMQRHEMEMQREQQVKMNEMKLRFFTNVSHDFRTPLTLIITPLQAMMDEVKDEKIRRRLASVLRNAELLLTLVKQLLDFRKLDVGAESIHMASLDFVHFIEENCLSFQEYAVDRHIHFTVLSEEDEMIIDFDADKMQKILVNLLSNAFKYTPDGGEISVRVYKADAACVCLDVADTGCGISDEDKSHVFDRFFQTKQSSELTGTGVGLHIVHEYVSMHGGQICVEDNTPQGCVFKLRLPVTHVANVPSYGTVVPLSYRDVDGTDVSAEASQEDTDRKMLLIVEDNGDFRSFLEESLSEQYDVKTAMHGKEALQQMQSHDFDMIVSDIMMPVMDGLELCRRVKSDIRYSHIPVIMLTAKTADESMIEGLELGADDYITKPFNMNVLKLKIQRIIERTRMGHEKFRTTVDVQPSEIAITSLDQQLLQKAVKAVEERIDDSTFSVEDLSSEVGLTRGHLYKKLVSITGMGPSDFIRTIRLKRARQMLGTSQLQVSEVAYKVGFSSAKLFSKHFKTEFGVSPSEYAKGVR